MKLTILCVLLFLTGCASPNPNYNASQPIGPNNQPNIPNQTVTGIAAAGAPVAAAVPPPYNTILLAGLGLATAIAGAFATVKNNQAATAQATANQLAASVAAQPASVTQAILDHASNNEAVYPAVAGLVNSKSS